jgi:predicted nucleic acid-binding Zn ribbon protein
MVGEVLARHTRPVGLAQGVLTVRCDAKAWKEALEPEAAVLLRRLQAALGGEAVLRRLTFESP